MQYFGVPTCPYCKKRVNLIRTWSLKRQGEYQCPRCGGISNIFLSPLIYVTALLAIFAGGAMYFFHKFVLDDISLDTIFQVFLPFALFFLLSLFMVYLAKPVIKKVSREDGGKKGRKKGGYEERRPPAAGNVQRSRPIYDGEEYLPQREYRTGPLPSMEEEDRDMKVVSPAPYPEPVRKTPSAPRSVSAGDPYKTARPRVQRPVPGPAAPKAAAPAQKPAPTPRQQPAFRVEIPQEQMVLKPRRPAEPIEPSAHVASPVEIPSSSADFFAKYDDPVYIERRLRELGEKGDQEN